MKRIKIVKIIEIVILAILLLMLACAQKLLKTKSEYREPVVFEIFNGWAELPDFVNYCKEIWNEELRYDESIMENTWKKGDYSVFVYVHFYIQGIGDTSYNELIFITTTNPIGFSRLVYSTVTPFKFEDYPDYKAEKIKTYVFINHFVQLESKEEAKQLMNQYLDDYIEEYKDDSYNKYLIQSIKDYLLTEDFWEYRFYEYADHFVFYEPPGDFGGGIIVNKKTSTLDFLGSSVWMGTGTRYFPIN